MLASDCLSFNLQKKKGILFKKFNLKRWMRPAILGFCSSYQLDVEIVLPVNNNRDDSNDEIPLQSSVSHSQVHGPFEVVLKWLESQLR